jgi:hypothetical protein
VARSFSKSTPARRAPLTLAQAAKQAATAKKRVAIPHKGVAVIPIEDLRLLKRLEGEHARQVTAREVEERVDLEAVKASRGGEG